MGYTCVCLTASLSIYVWLMVLTVTPWNTYIEQCDRGHRTLLASASIDNEGYIDNLIDNNNSGQVLEHYLGLLLRCTTVFIRL